MNGKLEHMENLLKELTVLGYNKFQIDIILKDAVETTNLTALTELQLDELGEALEEQIEFAKKCKRKKI